MIKKIQSNTLEAAVVMPLEAVERLEPTEARQKLLTVLLQCALAGDVRAAKLYLDYSLRQNIEAQTGLTLEQAIELTRSQTIQPEAYRDED
jgi:hypothetical protein